jgi:hypothetical protein
MPHVHVGFVEFLTTAAYVLIFTFLWRLASAALADKPLGRAMAAVYS